MTKRVLFQVELEMKDPVTSDNEINEMSENIARAIVNECNSGEGISSSDSDNFTQIVRVKGWYSEKEIIKHAY